MPSSELWNFLDTYCDISLEELGSKYGLDSFWFFKLVPIGVRRPILLWHAHGSPQVPKDPQSSWYLGYNLVESHFDRTVPHIEWDPTVLDLNHEVKQFASFKTIIFSGMLNSLRKMIVAEKDRIRSRGFLYKRCVNWLRDHA